MKKSLFIALACLLFLVGCNSAGVSENQGKERSTGDDYPNKSIQVIIPYSAGGGTDTFARLAAKATEEAFGQSLVIVNKPGSSGEVGATAIADATPDGYTLGYIGLLDFALLPSIKETTYQHDQFKFLASFTESSTVLIAGKDKGFETLEDVVAYAKQNPGGLSVSVSGDGHKYILMQLEQEAGIDLTPVAYSGGGESLNAVIGGHVDMAIISQSFVQQTEEQGLKTIAVTSEERVRTMDHVPTFLESGYNVTAVDGRVMVAPAGISDEVAAKLKTMLDQVGQSGKLEQPLEDIGEIFAYKSGEELDQFIQSTIARIQEVVDGNEAGFNS